MKNPYDIIGETNLSTTVDQPMTWLPIGGTSGRRGQKGGNARKQPYFPAVRSLGDLDGAGGTQNGGRSVI